MIETVFEEFTEFRFHTSDYTKDEFVPATLNYLPEGMQETKHKVFSNGDIISEYHISL